MSIEKTEQEKKSEQFLLNLQPVGNSLTGREQDAITVDIILAKAVLRENSWLDSGPEERLKILATIESLIAVGEQGRPACGFEVRSDVAEEGAYDRSRNTVVMLPELLQQSDERPALRCLFQHQRAACQHVVVELYQEKERHEKSGTELLLHRHPLINDKSEKLWQSLSHEKVPKARHQVLISFRQFRNDQLHHAIRRIDAYPSRELTIAKTKEQQITPGPKRDVMHHIEDLSKQLERGQERG